MRPVVETRIGDRLVGREGPVAAVGPLRFNRRADMSAGAEPADVPDARHSAAHLLGFATPGFQQSLEMSFRSARGYFATLRAWSPRELQATPFFREHRGILEASRGAGYWLWKPYIIRESLQALPEGDILVYLDVGAMIVADPSPLFRICQDVEILLFAGHHEGTAGLPYQCGHWTKRDCFVLMGCDEPRYHQAPMADASMVVIRNGSYGRRFIDEWLTFASRAEIITDVDSSTGPELPDFVDHRHDQSILSLLAVRHGLPLFRGPSQYGNYCKPPEYRVRGEWVRGPYGSHGIFTNSPYGTIVRHHRLSTLLCGREGTVDAGLAHVMRVARDDERAAVAPDDVTYVDALLRIGPPRGSRPRILVLGPSTRLEVLQISRYWRDGDITVVGLPGTLDSAESPGPWPGEAGARVHTNEHDFSLPLDWDQVAGGPGFDVVLCGLRCHHGDPPYGLVELLRHGGLNAGSVMCWSDHEAPDGLLQIAGYLQDQLGFPVACYRGTGRVPGGGHVRSAGILQFSST